MNIHRYEVLAELGKGQFGDVSLAVGEVPGRNGAPGRRRLVAIKRLRESRNMESERLLKQEFALLDQVKHRAVVRVFEYLPAERAVVMEHVHGVTLRTILDDCARAREQVFTEAAIEIGCEVADALYQAYTTPGDNGERLSLVHRDLKPENIMLTSEGDVKLLDFGLARVENTDFVAEDASRVRGTPFYMAPEQARGEAVDHRTDLFALGLILYELLMGRPAHRMPTTGADPVAATFRAIEAGALDEECRELESKLPGMGPVVARLLQSNPRNRYPNGQDLLVDLRRQLYRDRGSYIKEFVSFYFGSLHPIGPPPDPDAPRGGRMSTEKRKSMEERLAETLADPGDPVPRAPVPVRRSVKPAVSPSLPAPEPPPVGMHAPPKITPRSVAASRPAAPLPPDDDLPIGVRGARPSAPAARPPASTPMGTRSPRESGMLEMVPLRNEDEQEASADPSATAFFAIPAPRTDRPKAAPPPRSGVPAFQAPSSGARPSSPLAFTPPAPGTAPLPVPAAPSFGAGGIGLGGAAQIGVGGAGRGSPFQTGGAVPTQGSADESRMQSTRVFALVFAALAMVCFATVLAGGIVWWKMSQADSTPAPTTVATAPIAPPKSPVAAADTGQGQAVPKVPAVKPRVKPSGAGGGTSTPPTPRASATGTVTVNFTGEQIPTKIEIACEGGFQQRVSLSGGSGSVAGVPTSGSCKMHLKGGVVSTPATVRGGGTYSCSVSGTTTVCR